MKHFTKIDGIGRGQRERLTMGSEFTPVFLLLFVAIAIAASMLIARHCFGRRS